MRLSVRASVMAVVISAIIAGAIFHFLRPEPSSWRQEPPVATQSQDPEANRVIVEIRVTRTSTGELLAPMKDRVIEFWINPTGDAFPGGTPHHGPALQPIVTRSTPFRLSGTGILSVHVEVKKEPDITVECSIYLSSKPGQPVKSGSATDHDTPFNPITVKVDWVWNAN